MLTSSSLRKYSIWSQWFDDPSWTHRESSKFETTLIKNIIDKANDLERLTDTAEKQSDFSDGNISHMLEAANVPQIWRTLFTDRTVLAESSRDFAALLKNLARNVTPALFSDPDFL